MDYKSEEIGKIILRERKRLKLTQQELGDKLGLVGKQISAYEKGKPAPPVDVMFKLCEVFGCELGYLLGEPEYTEGTHIRTIVHNVTGLSNKAIDNILTVTGDKESDLSFSVGLQSESYRRALDAFISSEEFIPLMELLHELDWHSTAKNRVCKKAREELGEELYEFAINNYEDSIDDWYEKHPEGELNDAQRNALSKMIDVIDSLDGTEYLIRIARFEAVEAFGTLLKRLYPGKDRKTQESI